MAAVFGEDQGSEPQFLFDFGDFPSAGYGATGLLFRNLGYTTILINVLVLIFSSSLFLLL